MEEESKGNKRIIKDAGFGPQQEDTRGRNKEHIRSRRNMTMPKSTQERVGRNGGETGK